MSTDPSPASRDNPVYEAESDTRYSVEVIAQLAGVDPETVLRYRELGFLRLAARNAGEDPLFDVECLRQLRRIEHLRATCEMNDTGLRLILDLLHETECLREEQRQRLR